jgi:hypothetical protein
MKSNINENNSDTKTFDFTSAGRYNAIKVKDLGNGKLAVTNYLDDNVRTIEIEAEMPRNSFQADLLYSKCEFYKYHPKDYTGPEYRQMPKNRVRW